MRWLEIIKEFIMSLYSKITITSPTDFRPVADKAWRGIYKHDISDDAETSCQVVVNVYGKEKFSWVNGNKDLINNQAADEDTRYGIGSFTKSFTGALVEKLIDLGYIADRDDLATAYLNPQYSFPEHNVTVEQLLLHTAAIGGDYTGASNPQTGSDEAGPGLWGIKYYTQTKSWPMTPQGLREHFTSWWKDQTYPGANIWDNNSDLVVDEFYYSNPGYIMLGLICEEAYKAATGNYLRLEELYKEFIFNPCEMPNASGQLTNGQWEIPKNQASSYTYWWGTTYWNPEIYAIGVFSAGCIMSSAREAANFLPNLSKGLVMSSTATEKFFDARINSSGMFPNSQYGSGIFKYNVTTTSGTRTLYAHGGIRDGFNTYALYDRELDISVVYVQNRTVLSQNQMWEDAIAMYQVAHDFYNPQS